MKVIRVHRFGEPSVMKLEEIADPDPAPAAGQVLVRIHAIGVNPVETYIRSGIYGERPMPFTPGTDAAGVVESVGANVTRFKPGDRVYTAGSTTGTYAQKTVAPEARVFPLPDNVTFAQGAALGIPYGTAHRALYARGQAKPGEIVLIHGASGGVGIAATQFARAAGLTVFGTAGSEQGMQLVREQGAHRTFDHASDEYVKQIMDATGGRGVDLILEMLANVNLAKDLTILAPFGRVVVIGSRGNIEIDPRQTMRRDADIRGMTLMNATDADVRGIHAHVIAGLENGALRPIIDMEIPLSEAPRAHEEVMRGGSRGKILLLPDD
jgi:NADPH2:quinone reductase